MLNQFKNIVMERFFSQENFTLLFLQNLDVCKIEVKLVWPWKENVTIEYIAKAVSSILKIFGI